MKHIVIILDLFGFFGGPERRAYRLALGLKQMGFEISIVSIMKANKQISSQAVKNGINVINVTQKENGSVLKSYRADVFLKLRRIISKINPDIIFTFEFLADYTTKMSLLYLYIDILTFIGSTEWKWERKKHRIIAMKNFAKKSKFYIANSENVKKNIIRVLPEIKNKIQIIRNPIDTGYFKPITESIKFETRKRYMIENDDFIFGSVVRFYNPKGADILIEAFAMAKIEAKLLLIGDGSMKNKLHNMVKKFGIESSVMFLGSMEATPEIYGMFDVSVVPSQKGGFDNVVIESLSCGIPTIATNATGISEVATNGVHLLITDISPESIAENMKRIFNDYNIIGTTLANNGRKLAKEMFDVEMILGRIKELIWA